jgi:outer membrane protein OmpA-like peptidoglycan-associated protein
MIFLINSVLGRNTVKKILACSLVAAGLTFAQTGLMGGTSGIHQQNAYTLGQWGIEVGTGGDVAFDSWSLSRGGLIYKNGQPSVFHDYSGTFAGNIHAAIGLADFLDVGLALPLYYDHANAKALSLGEGDLWKASRGDVNMWLKVRALGDQNTLFALAALVDLYLPTGDVAVGVRPRHAWYLSDEGLSTNPFTSDDLNIGATVAMTFNFLTVGAPLVWNLHAGVVYADKGSSTLVYGTGLNYIPLSWMEAFVEFSGEFRLESDAYDMDIMEDPMILTPGLRFHLPWNLDFALGLDMSIRALRNIGYDYEDEMKNVEKYTLHYYDKNGTRVEYGYVPTPNFAGTATLTWHFGGKNRNDSDGDGVENETDKCPHTPKVATVDSVGCPIDSDADGMVDGFDKCPNTPKGAEIDTTGCPKDSDKDGVFNGLDKCPNSVAGASVDSTGCEADGDKDGVIDLNDKCPNTKEGVSVDSVGCSLDADKDGVADELDKCPNTKEGVRVNATGCEEDSDKDGVADAKDLCPNTKEGVSVDSVGCPLDSDKDGVADNLDKCPNTVAGTAIDAAGCPLDFDKDGVPDGMDQCPNTKEGLAVDSIGCSSDLDKDGVADGLDKCPNTKENIPVDTTGCPLDSDKDGVADFEDKCPNTLPGVKIDKKGCPVNRKEDLERLKKGIAFETGSTKLTKASYATLDDIIKLMKKIEAANLEVQGHTDDTGSEKTNEKLSQGRAQAVVDYFVEKGIAPNRVRAVGFGSRMPIADNKTKAGRAKNRRVELVPFQ